MFIASWKPWVAEYGALYDNKDGDTKGSTTLSIAAIGMAVAYLLLLLAGATGALSVLVWLFGEMPDQDRRTGRQTYMGLRSTDCFGLGSAPSSQVEFERPENEAA